MNDDDVEYELTFTINYRHDGDTVQEIGFGGILGDDLEYLAHMTGSIIQNHAWETEPQHPDPEDVPERAVDYIPLGSPPLRRPRGHRRASGRAPTSGRRAGRSER